MPDKRLKTPADEMIAIPREALASIKDASAEELKILIYRFSEPEADTAQVSRETGVSAAKTEAAYAFWRGAGVFVESDPPKKRVAQDPSIYRNYDSEILSSAIDRDAEFRMVCDHAGQKLGKQLNKNDYSSLFYLYDFVGMPAEVICGVIEDCCAAGKPNLQYIFKKTVGLYDDGIDTYDKFEQFLARRAEINSEISRLRTLCGMGDRALTQKEQNMFDNWFGEWKMPFELIRLAYEKTVDAKGRIAFPYMNSILNRWYESGYTSVEDVANGEASRKTGAGSSFDTDEFIKAAMNRKFDD